MSTTEKWQPRPFQKHVYELISQGKNVILQAPTGAGKTDAALLPFIQNLEQSENALSHTCIYATPMRVLATQFYEKYGPRVRCLGKERAIDFVKRYEHLEKEPVSLQTGEQPDDPQFESILTFCTIDQLLASFLGVPYSVDGRRANLNVGAILSSYLVLDEFHLYPLLEGAKSCRGARTTAISMLSLLKSVTRFIIMTATFSTPLLQELKKLLDAEIVTVSDEEELNLIAEGRRRTFEVSDAELTAEAVLAQHDQCSLAVCNTVLRAQQLYWQIKEPAKERGIEVKLLHSRLTAEDRHSRSERVMQELGQAPKEWSADGTRYGWKDGVYHGKNLIVIATQVVEVGLDISVQTLHTEIAPANSLIQRAGRCARFANQEGRVIVYDLPTDAEGKRVNTRPYDKGLCNTTLLELRKLDRQQSIGFIEEQALIDAVHKDEDRDILERYKKQKEAIADEIFKSLNENHRGIASTLIRDVMQVQILIHDDPNEAIQTEPWRWQSFALHPGSLASRWKALEERAASEGLKWVARVARIKPTGETGEVDSRQETLYQWDIIANSGNTQQIERILREALMIVLPSKLVTYHAELGFVLLDGRLEVESTGYQSSPPKEEEKPKFRRSVMKVRSYREHIQGLVRAYNAGIKEQTQYVVQRLEELMGLSEGSIDQAIRLAIACHDLGKLGEQWQQWALEWQRLLYERKGWPSYRPPYENFFFAKTDFDHSFEQREWQKETKTKRPNHACESVVLGIELLAESLGAVEEGSKEELLLRAVCGAIARHHTSGAHEYGSTRLGQGAIEEIKGALEDARQSANWTFGLSHIDLSQVDAGDLAPMNGAAEITRPERGRLHELETWLYFVIVRALRLADQRADRFGEK
jgi:CRISPR-associated endonuclease/helicase Cas3